MVTANERLLDHLQRHRVHLDKYADSLGDRVVESLSDTEEELADLVVAAIVRVDGRSPSDPVVLRLLDRLDKKIEALRSAGFDAASATLQHELHELFTQESRFLERAFVDASPVVLPVALPPDSDKSAATMGGLLMLGVTAAEWTRRARAARGSRAPSPSRSRSATSANSSASSTGASGTGVTSIVARSVRPSSEPYSNPSVPKKSGCGV